MVKEDKQGEFATMNHVPARLSFAGLSKTFGATRALNKVSLDVLAGAIPYFEADHPVPWSQCPGPHSNRFSCHLDSCAVLGKNTLSPELGASIENDDDWLATKGEVCVVGRGSVRTGASRLSRGQRTTPHE